MADDKQDVKSEVKQAESANDAVQEIVDEETEQGYRGVKVDPTPDAHYTVAGVVAGKPTPESDPKAADKAGGLRFRGIQS